MATVHFDKVFTPAEANELIPRLELAVRELQTKAGDLRGRISELARLEPSAYQLSLPQLIESYPQLRESASQLALAAEKIESYGCVLKDIDQGLIDFPWEIEEGRIVFLCWQFGEPAVIAWHSIGAGFAQRQPLSGAPKHYLN